MGLLNGVPGLIYRGRNNPSWSMEFVSDGCEELTGYPAAWFVDSHEHSYSQLIVPDDVDYVWRAVQEALADRRPFELRYRIRGANGDVRNVWERGIGIYSASSEVLGIEGAIFAVR
jgi:PAS domain-containing protein